MARGGFRPGAGRPAGSKKKAAPAEPVSKAGAKSHPVDAKTPLEYLLSVMNDPTVSEERRDRLAIAAAPFVHARAGAEGKKDQRAERAKVAASGRFAPPQAPKLVVNNK